MSIEGRFAIVVSRFNEEVTGGLLKGSKQYLAEKGIAVAAEDLFHAPGAFEIPLIAQQLAQTGRSWSPPRWRMRGSVHVFIPGGWLSR